MADVVVIGAGIAGLAAAIAAAQRGATVGLYARGLGGVALGSGTVDLLGYVPERVRQPLAAIPGWVADHPGHPYARLDVETVHRAARWFGALAGHELLSGDPRVNFLLPTAGGALRPTALAPASMIAGQPGAAPILIVGLRRLKDFHPGLVAANLARSARANGDQVATRAVWVDIKVRAGEADSSALNHARAFDHPQARARLAEAVRPLLRQGEVVGVPAVLGLTDLRAWHHLSDDLGHRVFEVATPGASVPGLRLQDALLTRARALGVRVAIGSDAVGLVTRAGRVSGVRVRAAGHERTVPAGAVVFAPGGFESGALAVDSYGAVSEPAFGLPVALPPGALTRPDLPAADQPVFLAGLAVDHQQRPLDADGRPVGVNLYAAGGVLAGALRWRELSGEGIALASALRAVESITGEEQQ